MEKETWVACGVLSKSVSEIDLRTIDDTQFFQSLTARMLGIGNVTLVSADKEAPMLVLQGSRDIQVVSTGSLGLDIALGIGGLPKGRVV